jgi:hypothetical protein
LRCGVAGISAIARHLQLEGVRTVRADALLRNQLQGGCCGVRPLLCVNAFTCVNTREVGAGECGPGFSTRVRLESNWKVTKS